MDKVIIFGASDTGKRIYNDIKDEMEVILFVDQNEKMWGEKIDGISIYEPNKILSVDFEYIYIGVLTYYTEVMQLLKDLNIPMKKIVGKYVETPIFSRIECLKNIKAIFEYENICDGCVAELGVYQGDFAKEINRVFPKKKLYLFDTFEGFHRNDMEVELKEKYINKDKTGYFSNTCEQVVMDKMQYPESVVIKKGFFPDTANGIDEYFCFVNLDADLYAPTLSGLKFFYPRMVDGGIILVHDYFSQAFSGARAAVQEFALELNLKPIPIGDTLSIAIRK